MIFYPIAFFVFFGLWLAFSFPVNDWIMRNIPDWYEDNLYNLPPAENQDD